MNAGAALNASGNPRLPARPDAAAWKTACDEYALGKVQALELRDPEFGVVTVAATASWLSAWYGNSFDTSEKAAVRAACIQIAAAAQGTQQFHPMLGAQPLRIEPLGAWTASPEHGVTLTWRPHWSNPAVPVLLTLTRD